MENNDRETPRSLTNAERVLELLRKEGRPLDDDEIAALLGIRSRQQVHQICSRLAAEGVIRRVSLCVPGKRRKIHNIIERRKEPREAGNGSVIPSWQRRLQLLEAATGMPSEEILDQALALLARKLLETDVNGES